MQGIDCTHTLALQVTAFHDVNGFGQDLSKLQQRLQEVATPTPSLLEAGSTLTNAAGMCSKAATLLSANKVCVSRHASVNCHQSMLFGAQHHSEHVMQRGAVELEVHTNVITRSPRQSSKRHKLVPSQISLSNRQATGVVSANLHRSSTAVAMLQSAPQHQVKAPARTAWSVMLGHEEHHGTGWTQPLARPPQLQLPTLMSADDDSHDVQTAGAAHSAFSSGQTVTKAEQEPSKAECGLAVKQPAHVDARSLAARLHCMQADAKDKGRHCRVQMTGSAPTQSPVTAAARSKRMLTVSSSAAIAANTAGIHKSLTSDQEAARQHPHQVRPQT